MKKFLLILTMLLVPVLLSAGISDWFKGRPIVEYTWKDVPMVHLKDSTKWCCNPDDVIKQETVDSIDFYCRKLNSKGVESVVVIVKKVKDADCFRVAQDIGNNYGVGSKETRRGLVIVVAYSQHKYFIATGKGLEAELTDADCNHIAVDYLKPAMKDENPDKAMLNVIKAVWNKIDYGTAELYKGQLKDSEREQEIIITILVIIAILFILLCIVTKGEILVVLSGSSSSGSSGGSFGGGSFGGGGAGGSW